MLRIDELAELGCCCFCSILYIANDNFVHQCPDKVRAFMRAVKRAADDLFNQPQQAWQDFKRFKKSMQGTINDRIFERSFAYMSRDCANGKQIRYTINPRDTLLTSTKLAFSPCLSQCRATGPR